MASDDVYFVDADSHEWSGSGSPTTRVATTMTFGAFTESHRQSKRTTQGAATIATQLQARQPPPSQRRHDKTSRHIGSSSSSSSSSSSLSGKKATSVSPSAKNAQNDIERGYVDTASTSPSPPPPPPALLQSPSLSTSLRNNEAFFEYKIPADAGGMLAPSVPPRSHIAQRNMFKSRVALLLLLQVLFFAGAWAFDLTWPIPETVLGTCAFVGVFFLGIAVLSLHAFKRMHPFSYLCVFLYNFFSVPYFIIAARFFESAFIGQFLAYYGIALLVILLTSTCLTVMGTFLRTLFLVILTSGSAVWIVYLHYIERWLGPEVPAAFHHSCFAAFYVALSMAAYVLYCINFPVDKYNCYDYVVAFIDINLFGLFKLFRKVRFCLSVLFVLFFVAALVAEKTLEFKHL